MQAAGNCVALPALGLAVVAAADLGDERAVNRVGREKQREAVPQLCERLVDRIDADSAADSIQHLLPGISLAEKCGTTGGQRL